MPDERYSKVALTLEEQAELLKARGLQAESDALLSTLGRISYYRFSGYAWNFRDENSENFETGTTLEMVMNLYHFDRRLRELMFGLATVVELELRARFVHAVGIDSGPMGYADPNFAHSPQALQRDLDELRTCLDRNSDGTIENFYTDYVDEWPPVWLAAELMSFGLLSRWFDNLKSEGLRKDIASNFGLAPPILTSYLRQLTIVRNVSAHHMRLWNRHFSTGIKQVKRTPHDLVEAVDGSDEHKIYRCLAMSAHVAKAINPASTFVATLREHLLKHDQYLGEMDVPTRFETYAVWS